MEAAGDTVVESLQAVLWRCERWTNEATIPPPSNPPPRLGPRVEVVVQLQRPQHHQSHVPQVVQAGAEDSVGVSGGDHNLSRSVVGVDALGVSGEASKCRLLSQ